VFLSLRQLLDLPVLSAAQPEIVHGDELLDRAVRWVHSSDIHDIAPHLKGGEVLLTTGLGLVGASDEQLRAYVLSLAERAVTALVFELGRTFLTLPPALVDESRRHEVVLIALHRVVPFIQVTETVHELLINQQVRNLRRGEQICAELTESLQAGGGPQPLLRRLATLAGCPAVLLDIDDRVVAASEEDVPSSSYASRRLVEVLGVEWGHLILAGSPSPDHEVILDRGAALVAMELQFTSRWAPDRFHAGRELLLDMALNRFRTAAELSARAAEVGLVARGGQLLVAVCVSVNGTDNANALGHAAGEAGRRVFGSCIMTRLDGDILMAGGADLPDDQALRALLRRIADTMEAELAVKAGSRTVSVAAGSPVRDAPGLVGSLARARETSALARRLGGRRRILIPADLGMHRLLSRVVGDPELSRFIEEQLGVLLEHDARRGRELVRTLDAYLANNLSKTHTAAALGVRRQTLYARLKRIEGLLGDLDLGQRDRRTALDLALAAWRLQSTGAFHQHRRQLHNDG
jgi:purine catabolism regulator